MASFSQISPRGLDDRLLLFLCERLPEELPCGAEESIHHLYGLLSKQVVLDANPYDDFCYGPEAFHELLVSFKGL